MLYAKLDSQGNIVDINTTQSDDYHTLVAPDNPIVATMLVEKLDQQSSQDLLHSSDQEMMRVLEDLIDLLSEKRLIQFTELPLAAQKKILSRKWVRHIHTGNNESLIVEETNDTDSLI